MRKILFSVLPLALIGFAGTAHAQVPGLGKLSLRGGLFFPNDSDVDGSWPAFGLDYRMMGISLPTPGVGLSAYLTTSIDYYERDGNRNIPLTLSYNLKAGPVFYSAGIGPGFYRLASGSGDERVGLDFQASLGYEFGGPMPLFIQGKYFQTPRDETSGFAVYLGVRF